MRSLSMGNLLLRFKGLLVLIRPHDPEQIWPLQCSPKMRREFFPGSGSDSDSGCLAEGSSDSDSSYELHENYSVLAVSVNEVRGCAYSNAHLCTKDRNAALGTGCPVHTTCQYYVIEPELPSDKPPARPPSCSARAGYTSQ